jgi:spore coat protein CotH
LRNLDVPAQTAPVVAGFHFAKGDQQTQVVLGKDRPPPLIRLNRYGICARIDSVDRITSARERQTCWRVERTVKNTQRSICPQSGAAAPSLTKSLTFFFSVWIAFAVRLYANSQNISSPDPASLPANAFGDHAVYRIDISLQASEVEALRIDPRKYVRAEVKCDGQTYSDIGIHLKGSTGSFRKIDDKPGLTLDFDRFKAGQSFCGSTKIHLNNAVEDPTYLAQQLGSAIFLEAGIPAPRVGHAVVTLNGRSLGLYVLVEGFTPEFLQRHFGRTDGQLYEPGDGHDLNEPMKLQLGKRTAKGRADLAALAAAILEPNLEERWIRLQQTLDCDRFVRFMVLEVMLGHRDGYCLARNNFRIYIDPTTKRVTFLPHGMDQLFGKADFPWRPQMAGAVARAVMETTEGRKAYEHVFRDLFAKLYRMGPITNRLNKWVEDLRPSLPMGEFTQINSEVGAFEERISARGAWLKAQIESPEPMPLPFENGIARLGSWDPRDPAEGGTMDKSRPPGGQEACLRIEAGPSTASSWRTQVLLEPGRYRFEGRVRVVGFKPLPFGKHQGASLRVLGRPVMSEFVTDGASWRSAAVEFEVGSDRETSELVCEFRASGGEVWFDLGSLHLVKLR